MAQVLSKGANAPIATGKVTVIAGHKGPDTDLSALLLTAAGKVRSDSDFVFYGNPRSPEGSVVYVNKTNSGGAYRHQLTVDLNAVPADVERIALTLTIDPSTPATFATVKELSVAVGPESAPDSGVQMSPEGAQENAFIVAELYKRNGAWKVRCVGQGFTNGLAGIATAFGVDISDEPAPTPVPPPPPPAPVVSLTKTEKVLVDLEKKGSRLVSLQKAASVSLKKNKLDGVIARVMMVLDASGSTSRMWPAIMQGVLDRLATLALNLDDNGELEVWIYATKFRKMATVKLSNLDHFMEAALRGEDGDGKKLVSASKGWGEIVPGIGGQNNEPLVMQDVLTAAKETPDMPTLCIFVTDGGIDKGAAIKKMLIEASNHPIFWQFVGLGGSNYGVLENFDTMTGRYVDNAGFFAIDDYRTVPDTELYDRLVQEFPSWLAKVKQLGMLHA